MYAHTTKTTTNRAETTDDDRGGMGTQIQTFIKPAYLQINLEAKSKPGGQNGLIWNKYLTILSN